MDGKIFGVTHDANTGAEMLRSTKELKVGIGIPQGPSLHVWLQRKAGSAPGDAPLWHMTKGFGATAKTAIYKDRAKAEQVFREQFESSPVCSYPRRLAYFTFSRPELVDGKLQYFPDWDAIEAHGETPTKIDILVTERFPLSGGYAMWSRSELRCKGDGINAMRVVGMAKTPEEKIAAEACAAVGEKYFPIMNGCATMGCAYFGKDCKVGGDFRFQVIGALRIGGCAFLHTTSAKSANHLFSGLVNVFKVFKRIEGIPLKLELQSWRAAPPGEKPSTQYAYKIGFDAPTVEVAKQKVLEAAFYFSSLANEEARPAVALIEAGDTDAAGEGGDESPLDAASMTAEFYPDAATGEGEAEEPVTATPDAPIPAAAATQATTAGLAGKLAATRTRRTTTAPVETVAAPVAEAPVVAPAAPAAETVPGDMF